MDAMDTLLNEEEAEKNKRDLKNHFLKLEDMPNIKNVKLFFPEANPAMLAAMGGHVHILEWMKTATPSIFKAKDSKGRTLYHYAAAFGKIEVVKWLKDAVANPDINAKDVLGYTFTDYAEDPHLLKPLPDASAAMMAAYQGRMDILQSIEATDPESLKAKDKKGRTLMHYAACGTLEYVQLDVMKWLHSTVGLDVQATDDVGQNAVHYSVGGESMLK